jgi:hypothetical protein
MDNVKIPPALALLEAHAKALTEQRDAAVIALAIAIRALQQMAEPGYYYAQSYEFKDLARATLAKIEGAQA